MFMHTHKTCLNPDSSISLARVEIKPDIRRELDSNDTQPDRDHAAIIVAFAGLGKP